MSIELNKESVEQADASSCQGTNCGTTTGDHSSECLAEAAAGQGWELKPGDLCGRDCPIHKILAEQAGGDERVKCAVCVDSGKVYDISGEGPWKCYACTGSHEVIGYANGDELDNMLDDRTAVLSPVKTSFHTVPVYREARAALAQPSDEVVVTKNESGAIVSVTRQDKEGRVLSVIAESQPSPAQAGQAEAERPEVVAYADPIAFATFKKRGHEGGVLGREWMWAEPGAGLVAMSRTDECECIIGELRTEIAMLRSYESEWELLLNEHEQQRDAALARVAELEKQEPVAWVEVIDRDYGPYNFHGKRLLPKGKHQLYAAPVAQAQQLNDLDKQCRDDVARALGLRPNQERGFAWSYLLASIKSCVKASGDSAQAQHSVPDGAADLCRFLAKLYCELDGLRYSTAKLPAEQIADALIFKWPVLQGARNQLNIKRISEQPYDESKLHSAIAAMLAALPGKEGV